MLFPTPPNLSLTVHQEPSATQKLAAPSAWKLWDEESINEDEKQPQVMALRERQKQAALRLRERLSGVPFYARAAKLWEEQTGDPMAYWMFSVTPASYMHAEP